MTEYDQFEQYLLSRRNSKGRPECTPRTAHEYACAVARILQNGGDLVAALKQAAAGQSSSAASMIRSAGRAWAIWKKDETLQKRLTEIRVTMSHEETKSADFADWARLHTVVEKNVTEPYKSALLLLSTSGLRIGDLFMLTREQASRALSNYEITILQKGQKPRVWSAGHDERGLLQVMLQYQWATVRDIFDHTSGDQTLTERQHYLAAYDRVRKLLQAACKAAGVEYIRPHRHRHTVATFAGHNGTDMLVIQKMLGHALLETTSRFYLHTDAKQQITEKDRLAEMRKALKS